MCAVGPLQVLLPHRNDVLIEDVSLGSRWLVVSQRSKAQQALVAYELPADGSMPTQLGEGQLITFDEAAYTLTGGALRGLVKAQSPGNKLCTWLLYACCIMCIRPVCGPSIQPVNMLHTQETELCC